MPDLYQNALTPRARSSRQADMQIVSRLDVTSAERIAHRTGCTVADVLREWWGDSLASDALTALRRLRSRPVRVPRIVQHHRAFLRRPMRAARARRSRRVRAAASAKTCSDDGEPASRRALAAQLGGRP